MLDRNVVWQISVEGTLKDLSLYSKIFFFFFFFFEIVVSTFLDRLMCSFYTFLNLLSIIVVGCPVPFLIMTPSTFGVLSSIFP